jgi:hypothetical protein
MRRSARGALASITAMLPSRSAIVLSTCALAGSSIVHVCAKLCPSFSSEGHPWTERSSNFPLVDFAWSWT